uniref:Putative secreted protein n=1 Tax=Ixodes ricinus TaxID=34613 RepID=A0A6B0UNB3_IXORI
MVTVYLIGRVFISSISAATSFFSFLIILSISNGVVGVSIIDPIWFPASIQSSMLEALPVYALMLIKCLFISSPSSFPVTRLLSISISFRLHRACSLFVSLFTVSHTFLWSLCIFVISF